MENKIFQDKEYKNWISELSNRYRSAQIKAAVAVNKEMLQFYWDLGKEITERQEENKYGSGFFKQLSKDLKLENPDAHCFSVKNLYYIRNFYRFYSKNFPSLGGESNVDKNLKPVDTNFHQPVGNSKRDSENTFTANFPQLVGKCFTLY